eukprot:5919251-Pyramimonas_sp.AAC.1
MIITTTSTWRWYATRSRTSALAYAALELIGMVGETGMQENRLQLKKLKDSSEKHDAYFIRPSK